MKLSAPGLCEICGKNLATRKATFTAQYLQSTSVGLFDDEALATSEFEKRTCEHCLESLQNAKNVSNLKFDRL